MSANLKTPPAIQLNGTTEPTTMNAQAPIQKSDQSLRPAVPMRNDTSYSNFSTVSVPPEGSILTGKQEHCKAGHDSEAQIPTGLTTAQISSANSSRSRPNSKSPSSPLPPP